MPSCKHLTPEKCIDNPNCDIFYSWISKNKSGGGNTPDYDINYSTFHSAEDIINEQMKRRFIEEPNTIRLRSLINDLKKDLYSDEKFIDLRYGDDNGLTLLISNYGKVLSIVTSYISGGRGLHVDSYDTTNYKNLDFYIPIEYLYLLKEFLEYTHTTAIDKRTNKYQIQFTRLGNPKSYITKVLNTLEIVKRKLEEEVYPPPEYEYDTEY